MYCFVLIQIMMIMHITITIYNKLFDTLFD